MMWRMLGEPHPMAAHRLDSRIMSQIGGGPDPVEGVESFLAKRPPEFPGRVSKDMPPRLPLVAGGGVPAPRAVAAAVPRRPDAGAAAVATPRP